MATYVNRIIGETDAIAAEVCEAPHSTQVVSPPFLVIYLSMYLSAFSPPQVKSLNQAITSSERKAAGHPMAVRLEAQVQLKEAKEVMHGLGPGGDL